MSSSSVPIPVPRPRTQRSDVLKKPIPLPRASKPSTSEPEISAASPTMSGSSKPGIFNTIRDEITERVQEKKKMVMEASRQIGEDLSEKITDKRNELQEKKRAVIESARNAHQTVRKSMVRRFGSHHRSDDHSTSSDTDSVDFKAVPEPSSEIFHGITFESPMTLEKKKKAQNEDVYSEPPNYPPPPYPDESLYDEPPPSSTSGSSSSYGGTLSNRSLSENYEEVVLLGKGLLKYAQTHASSDTDCDKATTPPDKSSNHGDRVHRSESWSFYDSVSRPSSENVTTNPRTVFQMPPKEELAKMNILRLSELSSYSVANSMYENHILQPQSLRKSDTQEPSERRVTESVIIEFDPLANFQANPNIENDLSFLESMLQGDTYGEIVKTENHDWSQSEDESDVSDTLSPPTPPKRFDSLPQEIDKTPQSNWFVTDDNPTPTVETTSENNVDKKSPEKRNWMKQRLSGVFQKLVPETTRNISRLSFRNRDDGKLKIMEKSPISPQPFVTHQGPVIKVGRCGGVEDFFSDVNPRWCYLGSGKLLCYTDNTLKVLKETINIENILSIQLISQNKIM